MEVYRKTGISKLKKNVQIAFILLISKHYV